MTTPPATMGRVLATAPGSAPGLAARPVAPGRDELIDALAIAVATVIAVVGFRAAYGGSDYLIAGAAGVVLGLVVSHLGQRLRIPLLGIVALGVLTFVLAGGLVSTALLGGTVAGGGAANGAVPTPQVMHDVLLTAVDGWKQLLTTAHPVGTAAHLLVLPYLLGLASGVASHALATRTRLVLLPALPPAGVAALSILFGAAQPTAALLQGGGLAAVCLAWAAARQQRGTYRVTTIGRQRPWQRIITGAAVLAVAVAGAKVLGPALPGASAHQRVVLTAVPPSVIDSYPSPLDGFRQYTNAVNPQVSLYKRELLSTNLACGVAGTGGLPACQVQIAVMDSYDGVAWGVANAQASTSTFGGFQRVGATLPGGGYGSGTQAVPGPARTATFTIDGAYPLPWLPDLAGMTAITFAGPDAQAVQDAFRFNAATGTGVIPGVVPAGLTYTVQAVPPGPTADQLWNATPYGFPAESVQVPPAVMDFANKNSGDGTPMQKVRTLAGYLKEHGHYSDGGADQSAILPGHSEGRLASFLGDQDLTGDDEQYAAAMALLANAVGVPARVSLDGSAEPDGGVFGRDVHADVELDLAGYGWVMLPYSDFVGTAKPAPAQQNSSKSQAATAVPQQQPPAEVPVSGNTDASAQSRAVPPERQDAGFHIPAIVVTLLVYAGIPLAVIAVVVAGLTGAKAMRRRRRQRGPAAARVVGAWDELVDLGRDMGVRPDLSRTRREQAATYAVLPKGGMPAAPDVARATDAAVFAPGDPTPDAAARIWALTAETRRAALASLPGWRRAWVRLNPASLIAIRG
jgi:hypothetical protein